MQRPFTVACRESSTVAEVLDRMGASKYSGNYRRAAIMAERLGVELPVGKKGEWRGESRSRDSTTTRCAPGSDALTCLKTTSC